MPVIDLLPMDATYISRDAPDADYSQACALVAASTRRRGVTEAILLKYAKPSLPAGTVIRQAELVLHPWQHPGLGEVPAFSVYSLRSDFQGPCAAWERRPQLADFPLVTMPASTCGSDGAIHCGIPCQAKGWILSCESSSGIAVVAEADGCLMVYSGRSAHPPLLRLLCSEGSLPEKPEKEEHRKGCGPSSEEGCAGHRPSGYRERVFTLEIDAGTVYTPAVDISQARTVTFFIRNCSCTAIQAALQVSPDGLDWMDERQCVAVPPEGLTAITPYLFARYIRAGVSSFDLNAGGTARVWFQAQLLGCHPA